MIFNCYSIPIELSFQPESMQELGFVMLNVIVDLVFLVDIFICFRTSFLNDDGLEVMDLWMIAKRYMKGDFFVDFFATIPIDWIAELIHGKKI